MTPLEIFAAIVRRGGSLELDPDGVLSVSPSSRLPKDLIAEARAHVDELTRLVVNGGCGEAAPCWRCGAPAAAPSLDEQVETVRALYDASGELYSWTPAEWTRLRALLKDGDVLAVAANIPPRMMQLTYAGIWLWRDGRLVEIPRGELAAA